MKPLHLHIVISTFDHVGFTGARLTVMLYAAHLQVSPAWIGVLAALFGALSALSAVHVGRWIDRVGARAPMLLASTLSVSAGLLAWSLPGIAVLFVASAVIGTFHSMFQIATQQTVGRYGKPEDRPSNFSQLSLGTSTATFSGPLIAGLAIDHLSHPSAFLLLALCALVPLPFNALRLLKLPPLPARKAASETGAAPEGVWMLLKNAPLRRIYIVATLNNGVWSVVTFLIPLYGALIGLSATRIGGIMAAFGTATVLVRIVLRLLLRRFTPWQLLLASQALVSTAFVGIPLTRDFTLLLALSFWMGLGLGLAGPMSTSLLYDASPPDRMGEVVGLRVTLANLCQTFVPLASGALGAAIGVAPVFWTLSALLIADAYGNRRELFRNKA